MRDREAALTAAKVSPAHDTQTGEGSGLQPKVKRRGLTV